MIYESNKSLAINNLPFDLSTDLSFPMDVMMLSPTDDGYATQTEQVDLAWDITDLPEGITLELTNNITGQNIDLNPNNASVEKSVRGAFGAVNTCGLFTSNTKQVPSAFLAATLYVPAGKLLNVLEVDQFNPPSIENSIPGTGLNVALIEI